MAIAASRMNPRLSLTPRASSHFRSPSPKSPSKHSRSERDLALKQVIGTTTTSANGFDSLESAHAIAFIAGAAAVVATLDENLQLSQKFFRARPSAGSINPSTPIYDSPTPLGASQGPRSRTAASLAGAGVGASPFGSPWQDALDSPNSKSSSANSSRSKAVTCVSLSRDGKLLALGEAGHRPRILIFSTSKDAPSDPPLTSITEHTFGVRCLAFSPDSQFLASLGDVNDGFLYIWNVSSKTGFATLHSSNKCTSYIRQIVWLRNSLITVGTRHVKIWRIGETHPTSPNKRVSDASFAFSSPSRPLAGRNCLLGSLLDKTFTTAVPISPTRALVCSDQGDICLLDDDDASPSFKKVADAGFCINAIANLDCNSVLVAGNERQVRVVQLQDFSCLDILRVPSSSGFQSCPDFRPAHFVALAVLRGSALAIDSERNTCIFKPPLTNDQCASSIVRKSLPAHGGPILGIQSLRNSSRSAFFTWSSDGSILFWDSSGTCKQQIKAPLSQGCFDESESANELKVVRAISEHDFLVTGDKAGLLQVLKGDCGTCVQTVRAHAGEITDITVYEQETSALLATCGRDRMVQLFTWQDGKCTLVQTLDDHVGAVARVIFTSAGKKLVSCSADRTIVIRDAVCGEIDGKETMAFLTSRTITLKSSPLHMDQMSNKDSTILVSTADRYVIKYDCESGNLVSSFKTSDAEGGDSVMLNLFLPLRHGKHAITVAGVSSFDKSIRLYSDDGLLLAQDFGHTEGITGMTYFEDAQKQRHVVTVATDGTIFLWRPFAAGADQILEAFEGLSLANSLTESSPAVTSSPPLRRVFSSSELKRMEDFRKETPTEPTQAVTPSTPVQQIIKRRTSRLSLMHTPKLEPSPLSKVQRTRESLTPTSLKGLGERKISSSGRASPPSPRRYSQTVRGTSRQSVVGTYKSRRRSQSATSIISTPNELTTSTEHVCRTLHAFRKKLTSSTDVLPVENVKELEKELSATARALAEKAARNEAVMVKLLDQYSERLVGMLDERIATSVARQVGRKEWNSEGHTCLDREP